ncbi:MAG: glycogen-binding domain-containing protein, partial [Planctomycetota bacterium]
MAAVLLGVQSGASAASAGADAIPGAAASVAADAIPGADVPAFEVPPRDRAVVPCASVEARPTAQGDWRVRFTLRTAAAAGARSAQVAGSFTGWQGRPVAMARAADGSFTAETTVPDGRHAYKFVLDGSRWIADPANPARADDQNGGFNSVLALGAGAGLDPSTARAGDG